MIHPISCLDLGFNLVILFHCNFPPSNVSFRSVSMDTIRDANVMAREYMTEGDDLDSVSLTSFSITDNDIIGKNDDEEQHHKLLETT